MSAKSLGTFIKSRRGKASQATLARKVKVAGSYMSAVETGRTTVTLDMLERITVALVILCDKEPDALYRQMLSHAGFATRERWALLRIHDDPLGEIWREVIQDALYGRLHERIEQERG